MLLHRNQSSSSLPPDAVPVAGLLCTDWVLSVCVVCGHERPDGERQRVSCPTCGAQLRSFPLYRDLQAGR
jgi:rubrerythrin